MLSYIKATLRGTSASNVCREWSKFLESPQKVLEFLARKSVKTNCLLFVPRIGSRRNETVNGRAEQRGFQRWAAGKLKLKCEQNILPRYDTRTTVQCTAYPPILYEPTFYTFPSKTWRVVYVRNRTLAQLEKWPAKPGLPFVMVGSPS